jgi:hypothetical protein
MNAEFGFGSLNHRYVRRMNHRGQTTMNKSKHYSRLNALGMLILANVALSSASHAIDIKNVKPETVNDSGGQVNSPRDFGTKDNQQVSSASQKRPLAQRRAACFSRATDNLLDDQNACNQIREKSGRRECKAVAYLSYQIAQGECRRMQ